MPRIPSLSSLPRQRGAPCIDEPDPAAPLRFLGTGLALLAVLAAAAPAQDAPRHRPLIGRFVDPDGNPVAGATVTVAWNPGGHPGLGPAGTATGTTDARGYFTVPAPGNAILCAWATGPLAAPAGAGAPEDGLSPAPTGGTAEDAAAARAEPEDAGAWVTGPVRCTIGTPRLELTAARRARPRRIAIEGLDDWRELGPFRLRVHPCSFVDLAREVPVADDGTAELPLLPAGRIPAELVASDGEVLFLRTSLPRGDRLSLPAPVTVQVIAKDAAGAPVQGVAIHHRVGDLRRWHGEDGLQTGPRVRWRRAATTGADGTASVRMPLGEDPLRAADLRDFVLRASKQGCADSHSGREGVLFYDGRKQPADMEPPAALPFVMAPAQPLRGRLDLPPERLPEHLRLCWISKIAEDNGWTHLPRDEVLAIGTDGTFAFPSLPLDAYQIALHAGPAPWPGEDGGAPVPLPLALMPSEDRPAAGFDPLPGELQRTTVQIRGLEGTPCTGATGVATVQIRNDFPIDTPPLSFPFDVQGRASVLLPAGKWVIVVVNEDGFAHGEAYDAEGRARPLELQLEPWHQIAGTVIDGEGRPVPGATVSVVQTSSTWAPGEPDRLRDAIARMAQSRFARTETSAEGRFVLRFLAMGHRTMQARARKAGRESDLFPVEPDREPVELVLH